MPTWIAERVSMASGYRLNASFDDDTDQGVMDDRIIADRRLTRGISGQTLFNELEQAVGINVQMRMTISRYNVGCEH